MYNSLMLDRLTPIILEKQKEVEILRKGLDENPAHPIGQILSGQKQDRMIKSFNQALRGKSLSVIAEIKRKSPSKGALADIADPLRLAQQYVAGGASAISILTDQKFFGGSLEDLTNTAKALANTLIPLLRKDFIIDPIQIAEAIFAGADAILCIVAVTGKNTAAILHAAKTMSIDVLVEVHNRAELDIALESGAHIIGVNNRNLSSFEINTQTAFELLPHMPEQCVRVAESGIVDPQLARNYYQAGFNAVLIGETLVKSTNPEGFIRECRKPHD
jgi:indole-3-glycerol phosphate synthase